MVDSTPIHTVDSPLATSSSTLNWESDRRLPKAKYRMPP